MGVTPARKKRRMGGRGCLMSARPWGVLPPIRTIGHPLLHQSTEGDPSVRRRLHAEHTSRCWNKGGSPPSCQERWGEGSPALQKLVGRGGAPDPAWISGRPNLSLRSIGPINFFAVREVGGVTDFLEVGVTPGLFPELSARDRKFSKKSPGGCM